MAVVELVTRDEAAHRQFANAVDRFRRAEAELERAMADLEKATAAMRELKIVVDVEMKPATQAAWVEFRSRKRAT